MKTIFISLILFTSFHWVQAQTWNWSESQLFYEREGLSACVLDDSIIFSGGKMYGTYLNLIEIYDIGEDSWSIADPQSPARFQTSSVSANGHAFIAGGSNIPPEIYFSEVDVYSKETGEWTIEYLSEARTFIEAVALGNKVFFAGGASGSFSNVTYHDSVDIYDTETGIWSTESLSIPRCMIGAATAGSKVFFAGGYIGYGSVTDVIDIYDIESEEWTIKYLSEARAAIAAVAYGEKVYFAGGAIPNGLSSDIVDVYNAEDETWEDVQTLSEPRIVTALNVYDALIFTGEVDYIILSTWIWGYPNGVVDVYYPETGNWNFSVPELYPARMWYAYAAYNNKAYYAGGWSVAGEESNKISILEYPTTGIENSRDEFPEFEVIVYPNPVNSSFQIDYNLHQMYDVNITIYNNFGIQVKTLLNEYQQPGNQQMVFNIENLNTGIYFCIVKTNDETILTKIIKL